MAKAQTADSNLKHNTCHPRIQPKDSAAKETRNAQDAVSWQLALQV